MSTRSVIAREAPQGDFRGRFHHWDGYPSGVGQALFHMYPVYFDSDLENMQSTLIDQHPGGWSTIIPDWSGGAGPECYCHPHTPDKETQPQSDEWLDAKTADLSWCEYAYILTRNADTAAILRILKNSHISQTPAESGTSWPQLAEVALDGPEPDWEALDCQ